MNINGYLFEFHLMDKNINPNEGNESNNESFEYSGKALLPLVNANRFNLIVPIYMFKREIISNDKLYDFNKVLYKYFWQTISIYRFNPVWTACFITEHRIREDDNSLGEKKGNDLAALLFLKFNLNTKWQIMGFTRYVIRWLEDREESQIQPGFQLIHRPSDRFKIMTGVPAILSLEWAAPWNLDYLLDVKIENSNFEISMALRKRWNHFLNTTLRYQREGDRHLYINRETIENPHETFSFNNFSYNQNRFELDIAFNFANNLILQLRGGYLVGENITLYDNDDKRATVMSSERVFYGFSLTYKLD